MDGERKPAKPAALDVWGRALARYHAAGLATYMVGNDRDVWFVQSESNSDTGYLVTIPDGGPHSCGCEAGTWGKPCKHVAGARYRRAQLVPIEVDVAPENVRELAAARGRDARVKADLYGA